MTHNKHYAVLTPPATPAAALELVPTEREQWQAVLAPAPKATPICCNHRCKQGRECPIRALWEAQGMACPRVTAHSEDLVDDTGLLIGRGILLISSILTIALGVYLFA